MTLQIAFEVCIAFKETYNMNVYDWSSYSMDMPLSKLVNNHYIIK